MRQAARADLRDGAGDAAALRGGQAPARQRVLAIGDSVRTDLKGAAAFGLDCMFVTSGIHAEEYGSREAPDLDALNAIFAAAGVTPAGGDARTCLVRFRTCW